MSVITPQQFREAMHDWLGDRVKFHPDWPHATTAGGFDAHGIVHHWDAIPQRYRLETHLRVLRHGSSALPGPLCHAAPARNGDLWVIGWGNTNHAGNGDRDVYRKVLAGRFDGTPTANDESVDGNAVFYGFEYMYHPDDGEMPEVQFEAGVLAAAAIAEAHGWGPNAAAGSNLDHYEWAARKWDREVQNLANRTRAGVKAALIAGRTNRTSKGDDLMATKAERDQLIQELLNTPLNFNDPKGEPEFRGVTIREALKAVARGQVPDVSRKTEA